MELKTLEKLNTLPYLTKSHLRTIANEDENTLDQSIKRFIESEELIQLKKGIYTTKYFFLRNSNDLKYKEYIASILRHPSYLSTQYILSKYQVLTEVTFDISSITLKSTRAYENRLGIYRYNTIREALFTGFTEEHFTNFRYYTATKAKALFDYIYLRSRLIPNKLQDINLVEDWRLNLDTYNKPDYREIETYVDISGSPKIKNIFKNIKKHAPNNS